MGKFLILGVIILLIIGGLGWLQSRSSTSDLPKPQQDLEESGSFAEPGSLGQPPISVVPEASKDTPKCVCGNCNLDIFSCDCPTAKKQRQEYSRALR